MLTLIDLNQLAAMPWKNGGGVTRELAAYPVGSGLNDFIWRISIADVAQSAAFSTFTGIDRIITLLNGDGMRLEFADGRRHNLTTAFSPFHFRGEDPLHADLFASPSSDFNLMLRREAVTGSVKVWREPSSLISDNVVALVCGEGQWRVTFGNGAQYELGAQHALTGACPPGEIIILPIQPGSVLLTVRAAPAYQSGIQHDN